MGFPRERKYAITISTALALTFRSEIKISFPRNAKQETV